MGTHPIFESDFDCLTEKKMNMEECNICGRNFNPDALQRHRPICAKNANKQPRKQFNSQKNRINGTEINYTEVKRAEKRKPTVKELRAAEKKNLWRQKHEDFIQSVRAAKGVDDYDAGGGSENHNSGYDSRTYSKPRQQQQSNYGHQQQQQQQQRAIKPGYTHCDHCGRTFADATAERHIPWCEEQQRKKGIRNGSSQKATAAQKQAIRTQYKPPAPSKSRTKVPKAAVSSGYGRVATTSATTPSRYGQNSTYQGSPGGSAGRRALRKNCGDCLTIYPVEWAKYCCECGTKRIWRLLHRRSMKKKISLCIY